MKVTGIRFLLTAHCSYQKEKKEMLNLERVLSLKRKTSFQQRILKEAVKVMEQNERIKEMRW